MIQKIVVGVIMGGKSSEHDVSLSTGENIAGVLEKNVKYEVARIKLDKENNWFFNGQISNSAEALKKIDVAFIAMHGEFGEDGRIQSLLEFHGLPYTGSGVTASALAMDKLLSSILFNFYKIKTPSNILVKKKMWEESSDFYKKTLKFPVVVKPVNLGSSVGVSIVQNWEEFISALNITFSFGSSILIQEYIYGREFSCGVLERNGLIDFLPAAEIIPPEGKPFFDYESKYNGQTKEIIPADIDSDLMQKIQKTAIKTHQILGCKSYSRTDFIVNTGREIFVLENNTLPGFTKESLFPKCAKIAGIEFDQLLEIILENAFLLKNI